MSLIALRVQSQSQSKQYDLIVNWPSLTIHEVFEVTRDGIEAVPLENFRQPFDITLEAIRIDPILSPKNIGSEIAQAIQAWLYPSVKSPFCNSPC